MGLENSTDEMEGQKEELRGWARLWGELRADSIHPTVGKAKKRTGNLGLLCLPAGGTIGHTVVGSLKSGVSVGRTPMSLSKTPRRWEILGTG